MKKFVLTFILLTALISTSNAQIWQWAYAWGGTQNTWVQAVDFDPLSGEIVMLIDFRQSMTFGTTTFVATGGGNTRDMLLVKYNSDGDTLWTRQYGSTGDEVPKDVIVDNQGNIIITGGFTDGCDFDGIVLNTATSNPLVDDEDVFLAKITGNGNIMFAENVAGGPGEERGNDLAVDASRNIYIVGYFNDSIIFFDNDTLVDNGTADNFVGRFDPSGNYISSNQFICTDGTSRLNSISLANDGDLLISGFYGGTIEVYDRFSTLFQNTSRGDDDIYLVKTSTIDDIRWIRTAGSTLKDQGLDAKSDAQGNIYLVGYFNGTIDFDSTGTLQSTSIVSNGGEDIFAARYNTQGALQWKVNVGSVGDDLARRVEVSENLVHFTGHFSDTIIEGNDTISTTGPADEDPILATLDNQGNVVSLEQGFGAAAQDRGMALAYDPNGFGYVGGFFRSPIISFPPIPLTALSTRRNAFISKWEAIFDVTFTLEKDITCFGGNDGELIVTPFFGVPPYTYSWSHDGGLNDSTAAGLAAGFYKVIVSDNIGNVDSVETTLSEGIAIVIDRSVTDVSCNSANMGTLNDGAIDITVSGGEAPYTYLWTGSGVLPAQEDQAGLIAGDYTVRVTDNVGCFIDSTFTIGQPNAIVNVLVPTDVSIPGAGDGAVDLTASGGTPIIPSPPYTYFWYDSDTTFSAITEDISSLDGGTYSVTVTDDNGCSQTDAAIVLDDFPIINMVVTDITCNGVCDGRIDVAVSGGLPPYSYEWREFPLLTDTFATDLCPGAYQVVVTDGNLKTDTAEVTLVEPLLLEVTVDAADSVSCFGGSDGSVFATVTGGTAPYFFSWTDGGSYTSADEDIIDLPAGNYSLTVFDDNGCIATADTTVYEPADITITAVVTDISCFGITDGSINITITVGGGTPPYSYLWNNSLTSEDISNLPSGDYFVTVTDANGCVKVSTVFQVGEPAQIFLASLDTQDPLCNGECTGYIDVTGGGGTGTLTYFLEPGGLSNITGQFNDLCEGDYTLTIEDDNGCSRAFPIITLTDPSSISVNSPTIQDVACFGDTDGGNILVDPANGGTPPYDYEWWQGTTFITDSRNLLDVGPGTYNLRVFDANTCRMDSFFTIGEPTQIVFAVSDTTDATGPGICDGEITLHTSGGGTPPYEFSINGTDWQVDSLFTSVCPGIYTVFVRDANLCEVTRQDTVQPLGPPLVITSIDISNEACPDAGNGEIVIHANGGTPPYEFSIDNGGFFQDDSTFSDLAAGTYNIVVRDDNSLTVDSLGVVITLLSVACDMYDAFTPNGDGVNDVWNIPQIIDAPNAVVLIYSAWGNLVFESAPGYPEPWDGTSNGNELPAGTYFYVIDRGDGSKPIKGTVNIIK